MKQNEPASSKPPPPMRNHADALCLHHVLIASSEEIIRNSIKTVLGKSGSFRSVGARDGKQTIARLSTNLFGCLVIANQLGDVDPWRIVRIVRSGRFCDPGLPVMLLIDDGPEPVLERLAVEYGVHITKISDLDQIPKLLSAQLAEVAPGRPSVLVIEDNVAAAELAKQGLVPHFSVDQAHLGEPGLLLWEQTQPDLVLLDLQLPDISGREVLRRIRLRNPKQLVIIMTAYATTDHHRDLMLDGAAEFLSKPVDPRELRHKCEQILRNEFDLNRYQSQWEQDRRRQTAGRHLWAAEHFLETGRTNLAGEHLKHARTIDRLDFPTEDEWVELLNQFE